MYLGSFFVGWLGARDRSSISCQSHLVSNPQSTNPQFTPYHSNRASFPDQSDYAAFARPSFYLRILVIYDSDPADYQARSRLSQYPCVTLLNPPAHDL